MANAKADYRTVTATDRAPQAQPATVTASDVSRRARILMLAPTLTTAPELHTLLRGQGYAVECADTCATGVRGLRDLKPDLIITDWVLPDRGGAELCGHLRRCSNAAIMVVTSVDHKDACADALDAGADDYVVIPSRTTEFVARVAALLRRVKDPSDGLVVAGDITIELDTRDVRVGTRRVRLWPHEFDLLLHLARHPSTVQSYRTLLAAVWGSSIQLRPHYVRMCVAHLRRQIEPTPAQPRYLLTERSIGYRLEPYACVAGVRECA